MKIGTLVLYKNDDEPCLGIVTGESRSLADFDEEDLKDYYTDGDVAEGFKAKAYPVRWFDMQSVCCEQEENLIIVSEAR